MRVKLLAVLVVAAFGATGCGGDGGEAGTTVSTVPASYSDRLCIDTNQNLACDDGEASLDSATAEHSIRESSLTPSAAQRVVLERVGKHDGNRSAVLMSELGSSQVNGLSTLLAFVVASGQATDAQAARTLLTERLGKLDDALAETLTKAYLRYQQQYGSSSLVLAVISQRMLDQRAAVPDVAAEHLKPLFAQMQEMPWLVGSQDDTAETMAAVADVTVLGNAGRNRLFVLRPNSRVSEIEFENNALAAAERLPAVEPVAAPSVQPFVRAIRVDVVSAASGGGTRPPRPMPPTPVPPTIPPGTGGGDPGSGIPPVVDTKPKNKLSQLTLSADGKAAFVLFTTTSGKAVSQSGCGDFPQNTGVFRVDLTDKGEARVVQPLYKLPACTNEGFTQLAADKAGQYVVALSEPEQELYLFDGSDMHLQRRIKIDWVPQRIAVSPGGRYIALAREGNLALFELATGTRVAAASTTWSVPGDMRFAGVGRLVVASANTVHVINLSNPAKPLASKVLAQSAEVRAMDVAGDGQTLALALADNRIRLLEVNNGQSLGEYVTRGKADMLVLQSTRLVYGSRQIRDKEKVLDNTLGAIPLDYAFPQLKF
ncbi:WD40 repeat domain-containing protein [Chitinimonas sp. PSY-7]|uniref:WD40 repeat domain-containing protein n=1 Tax=Chitinimonas sp. PSY-7 TaxID=3459088 RepID=UPI00403FF431